MSGAKIFKELNANLTSRITMAGGATFDLDPKLFPNALEVNMGPEIKLPQIKYSGEQSGTQYDDPDYSPWDSVAREMISGDKAAVEQATIETERYIKWRKSMGMDTITLQRKRQDAQKLMDSSDELINWLDNISTSLEKLDSSSWHRFTDAVQNDMILTENARPAEHITPFIVKGGAPQHFLMQHQWQKLLSHATDEKGNSLNLEEFRLPFERCSFEMKMSGRRVISILHEIDGQDMRVIMLIECSNGIWYIGNEYVLKEVITHQKAKYGTGLDFMLGNIAAMCICIEANVIETEVVRAPHKLNAARAKLKKTPLLDHTVVSLARRYRVTNPMGNAPSGDMRGTRRMHFRRGHWRHYVDHKTWIKWMLVGNPDLGFVEHEYRA